MVGTVFPFPDEVWTTVPSVTTQYGGSRRECRLFVVDLHSTEEGGTVHRCPAHVSGWSVSLSFRSNLLFYR